MNNKGFLVMENWDGSNVTLPKKPLFGEEVLTKKIMNTQVIGIVNRFVSMKLRGFTNGRL